MLILAAAFLIMFLSMLQESWLPWAVLGMWMLSLFRFTSIDRPPGLGKWRWSIRTPTDIPAAILVLMALVSLLVTPLPEITRLQVFRLYTGILVFYAIVNGSQDQKRLRLLAASIVLAALGLAALGLFSARWPVNKLELIPAEAYSVLVQRLSDTIHPNVLAGNLAVLMPFALGLFMFPWKSKEIPPSPQLQLPSSSPVLSIVLRVLLGIGLLVMAGVLFLTQSRSSWLAFAAATAVIFILRFRWGWLALLGSGLAGAVIAYPYIDVPLLLRSLRSSFLVGELATRIEIWSRAVFMLEDFPFTGIGMGTFPQTGDALYPMQTPIPQHAHNLFLQVGVDLGIPGLIAWLSIWFLVLAAAWELWRDQGKLTSTSKDAWLRGLGAGLLGCQLVLAFHGLFDCVTWGMIRPAPLIWMLWGVGMGAMIWRRNQTALAGKE